MFYIILIYLKILFLFICINIDVNNLMCVEWDKG